MAEPEITTVIADDHPAVLRAIARLLEENGIAVVGRAADGEEAIAEIEAKQPQVALVDLRMPGLTGTDVARRAARVAPKTAIALYTGYGEQAHLVEALDAGAQGFISKEAPLADLVRAVRTLARGESYVDPVVGGMLTRAVADRGMPQLTGREREILRLLAEGMRNEDVGKQLFISPETVRTHIRRAMGKLNADTRTQAVATALRQNLIA